MKKNIVLIRENQYEMLQKHLVESQLYVNNIKLVLDELVNNYEPIITSVANGSEYVNEKRIKKKIDGSEMKPKELLRYLEVKFPRINKEFLLQVIKNWYNGDIGDDLSLSRNVALD